MTSFANWVDQKAQRPVAIALATMVFLQLSYVAYLAYQEYSGTLAQIDRIVETASLGIQQSNRGLVESTLATGLHNSKASSIAICRGTAADLLYPLEAPNPCDVHSVNPFLWIIRRPAIGLGSMSIVVSISWFHGFASMGALGAITSIISVIVWLILFRARRQFESEILTPLSKGIEGDLPLDIIELESLRKRNTEFRGLKEAKAVSEALFNLSAQVAHDIRSPLAVLDSALDDASKLPERRRIMIRGAVNQVRDIANNLLANNRELQRAAAGNGSDNVAESIDGSSSIQLLSSLIEAITTDKRQQFKSKIGLGLDARLDPASYGLFAQIEPAQFRRVLSNLINNAVEALGEKGAVQVTMSSTSGEIELKVQDNGKGIPSNILSKLGERGATHNKPGGTGLGLHHAKNMAESWGGSLQIESEPGEGTTVLLRLPSARPPEWFISQLELKPGTAVIILDDDKGIHDIWRDRFESLPLKENRIDVLHFATPAEERAWVRENPERARTATFLTDYELQGHKETGLDLVAELNLADRAILVTSRFGEKDILDRCLGLGVRLIPKGLAGIVPLVCGPGSPAKDAASSVRLDAVLIEDDELVRMAWEDEAVKHGKTFRGFSSMAGFFKEAVSIDRQTPVYVDVNLADGAEGDRESLRIYEMGFREIYLSTGHERAKFAGLTHLRGVISKDPPWRTPVS